MLSLTAPVFKNNHFLVRIYPIVLKQYPRPNLKIFQYKILTSVKRLEVLLLRDTHFSGFCHFAAPILG